MLMTDRLTLDAPRRCQDGSLVASVRAARTGTQTYAGYEVGKPDLPRVTVYRPEAEVFSRDSMASFASAPVTVGHPAEPVTTQNWKDHAVGDIGEEIVRDGEAVRVPIMVRDANAIDAIAGGTREISMGYSCDLSFEDGAAPDGTPYQAVQRNIRINHLAIVDAARGGPSLRIGDSDMNTKTIIVDGLQVVVTDAAEAAILKLQGQLADSVKAKDAADGKIAELTTQAATKDAEIATLKKQAEDAKLSPQQLRDAAKAYARTVDFGKKLAPKAGITDEMDEAAIKKAVVSARLGDAAKDWTDAQIDTSFATLSAGVKDEAASPDHLRDTIAAGPANITDARSVVAGIRAARYA
ncbi:MAG: DUF2213 domain-containing protein [Alphaproteobacteria bacterium]|nr:DUF2213 domain-containing protein [Alphaproteobacteria bacterium]